MAFHRLEKLVNLYDGYRQTYRIGRLPLLLIQENGKRWLIRDECPHKAFPLSTGTLKGPVLRCAYHAMEFNLEREGRCVQHPRTYCLTFYPLQYDGDSIGVELDPV